MSRRKTSHEIINEGVKWKKDYFDLAETYLNSVTNANEDIDILLDMIAHLMEELADAE